MRYDPIDPQLFVRNRDKLRALLKPNSIVIVLANDIFPTNADGTMAFKQNADLFYLTGVDQEETMLVLMPDAKDPKEQTNVAVRHPDIVEKLSAIAKEQHTDSRLFPIRGLDEALRGR